MDVEAHTTDVGGVPMFFWRAEATPDTQAPVVYLHGAPTDADDWLGLLAATGGVAPDLPGFGRSGKGGHLEYTVAALAGHVAQLLGELQLGRVRIAGHDLGAAVALELGAREPGRVERMVLCSPRLPPAGDAGPARSQAERLLARPLIGELVMGTITRRMLARWLRAGGGGAGAGAWSEPRVRQVWERFDQGTQRAILRLIRAQGADASRQREELRRVDVPVLILHGEGDPWVTVDALERLAADLPAAELVEVPGGHWPWLADERAAARIRGFLGGTPAGGEPVGGEAAGGQRAGGEPPRADVAEDARPRTG